MNKDYMVHDVMDVLITEIGTGKVMANTRLQLAAIESTIDQESIRGGIGNGKVYEMRSNKDMNVTTRNAVMNNEWISLTQGVDIISDKEVEVTKAEIICDVPLDGVITLEDEPSGKVQAKKADGTFEEFDAALKKITLTGDFLTMNEVQLTYKAKITGNSITFDAAKFSKMVRLDMKTFAYDLETGDILYDIYFVFPKAMPSSDLNLSYEAGSVLSPELSFSILQGRCGTKLGEMVSKPHVPTP